MEPWIMFMVRNDKECYLGPMVTARRRCISRLLFSHGKRAQFCIAGIAGVYPLRRRRSHRFSFASRSHSLLIYRAAYCDFDISLARFIAKRASSFQRLPIFCAINCAIIVRNRATEMFEIFAIRDTLFTYNNFLRTN